MIVVLEERLLPAQGQGGEPEPETQGEDFLPASILSTMRPRCLSREISEFFLELAYLNALLRTSLLPSIHGLQRFELIERVERFERTNQLASALRFRQ